MIIGKKYVGRITVAFTILCVGWIGPSRADIITYDMTADTSGVNGQTGVLDFQFNTDGFVSGGTDTAVITNFNGDGGSLGTFDPNATAFGAYTGSLPGTLTLSDSTGFTDYDQAFTFANAVQFTLTINTNANSPGAGLFFSMYDGSGNPVSPGQNGFSVLETDVESGGLIDLPIVGSGLLANPQGAPAMTTPEPASAVLCMLGFAGMAVYTRWRKRVRRSK